MNKPLFSLAIILASVFFGFVYVKPQYNRAQNQREAITSLNETLAIADRIKLKIEGTKKELENVSRIDSERFEVFLPEKIDVIRLANNLQHLGKTHGVVLADLKVEETPSAATATLSGEQDEKAASRNIFSLNKEAQKVDLGGDPSLSASKKYKISRAVFSVSASYGDFLELLADIERSLSLINITSLTFRPVDVANSDTSNTASKRLYQYVVKIETYSLN